MIQKQGGPPGVGESEKKGEGLQGLAPKRKKQRQGAKKAKRLGVRGQEENTTRTQKTQKRRKRKQRGKKGKNFKGGGSERRGKKLRSGAPWVPRGTGIEERTQGERGENGGKRGIRVTPILEPPRKLGQVGVKPWVWGDSGPPRPPGLGNPLGVLGKGGQGKGRGRGGGPGPRRKGGTQKGFFF